MGYSPKAILAYGYDLGVIADHFEWNYEGDELTGGPAWYDPDSYYADAAVKALIVANGVTAEQYEAMNWAEQEEATDAIGVKLIRHGGDEGDETLILASRVIQTDWEAVLPVGDKDMRIATGADDRLAWALDVLGIPAPTPIPQWLLAAHYS